jgi:hypothetical protein
MLSSFESAFLDRHLSGCSSCSSFAVAVTQQTALLRAAELEAPPARPILAPAAPRVHRRRAAAVMALSACVASLAAALVLVPGGRQTTTGAARPTTARGAPVLVSYMATPSPSNPSIEVPRLSLQPASYADGPVRGIFSVPTQSAAGSSQVMTG